jgi:phosphatidylcholine synthase
MVWTILAGIAAWKDFHPGPIVTVGLTVTSLYLLLVGLVIQFLYDRKPAI